MSKTYTLPKDWEEIRDKFGLIDADYYNVSVDEIREADHRIHVQFVILDEGKFDGRRLFQTYAMKTDMGVSQFARFLDAIDVEPDKNNEIILSQCTRRVLRVKVVHNEHKGKKYANVVEHVSTRGSLNAT